MSDDGRPPALELRRVTKRFGSYEALKDVSLEVQEGEFFSLLGPSGCGKTTSLRIMAGFGEPDVGAVILRGEDVTRVPPNKRNVNMVFQNYELFPHMTVFDNVAYGLRLKKVPQAEIRSRVEAMLAAVRVEGLEGRGVRQLSGGQQQRVALARALVNRPAVLLLDEPLSALDVKLRKQMQMELKAIQNGIGTTFVYVTHDQEEAFLMSDRLAVMEHGLILQVGTPREVYRQPRSTFVADFVGSLNTIPFRIGSLADGVARMEVGAGGWLKMRAASDAHVNDQSVLAVRPERIRLAPGGDDEGDDVATAEQRSRLEGRVADAAYLGATIRYQVETSAGTLAVVRFDDTEGTGLSTGARVVISWPLDAAFALAFDKETGQLG